MTVFLLYVVWVLWITGIILGTSALVRNIYTIFLIKDEEERTKRLVAYWKYMTKPGLFFLLTAVILFQLIKHFLL